MAQFEIYFVGLICFMNENDKYPRAEVLWDEGLEHVPFLYLGPSATKFKYPIPLTGQVSFGLLSGGPPADTDPFSRVVHLKTAITGSPVLRQDRPRAGTILLPNGIFGIAAELDGADIKLPSSTRNQAVAQLVLVACQTAAATVDVLVDGQPLDTVDASSWVLIGNVSGEHDPKQRNHFTKYKALTTGGREIATVTTDVPDAIPVPDGYPGDNYDDVVAYLQTTLPNPKTFGSPDCTITQWP